MTTFVIRKLCRNVGERRMDSGYYDPSTLAPDEQPAYPTTAYPYVKPPRSSAARTLTRFRRKPAARLPSMWCAADGRRVVEILAALSQGGRVSAQADCPRQISNVGAGMRHHDLDP